MSSYRFARPRGKCKTCKIRPERQVGRDWAGNPRYSRECNQCRCLRLYGRKGVGNTLARRHKKKYCEKCGPKVKYHFAQLQVDHIDGDKTNDDPENLQTLCANCHALKTYIQLHGHK